MPTTYYLAWWNLENLFDEENSPRRSAKLKRVLGNSIVGWTPELRDRKIDQLASIVAQMNGGLGPDLTGMCEIENEFVVGALRDAVKLRLPGRDYDVAHFDTRDERGIDIAFLYDRALFVAPADQRFQHIVMRRTATREIFQINFQTVHGQRTWAIFGNHWPSRSGGQLESAGYRAIAAETLAYFHQRVWEVHGSSTPVLAMGDFNDEPFDVSLVDYALSTREHRKVLSGTSPRFWNMMWPVMGARGGSFYFENFSNLLDQFLVDRNMLRPAAPISAVLDSAEIIRMPEMVRGGEYPSPIAFGGMGKPVNTNGFSDHFPIGMRVREAD
jgi:hypothetical protein